jgi:hypothetical protein
MRIINRKIITIARNLGTVPRDWEADVFLNFRPDQMIVKSITCNGNNAAIINNSAVIFSPTINEVLGSFYNNNCIVYPNTVFEAFNYPINSRWRFQIVNVDGTINTTFDGHLFFQLEFVKFA